MSREYSYGIVVFITVTQAVPDPDLEIGGSSRRAGGAVSKKFVRPFGPQFGQKIRGARPVDPPLPGLV